MSPKVAVKYEIVKNRVLTNSGIVTGPKRYRKILSQLTKMIVDCVDTLCKFYFAIQLNA